MTTSPCLPLPPSPTPPVPPSRLAVARVRGRWVGYPLVAGKALPEGFASAEGVLAGGVAPDDLAGGHPGRIQLLVPPDRLEQTALLLGCDPSLGILSAHIARRGADVRLLWLGASSEAALSAVANGEAHLAGSHLRDPATGEYNVPQARRVLGPTGGLVVAFARWELGLVVLPGNPKALRAVEDLARRDVRLVNREAGSGSRALLDELLARADVPPDVVDGYDRLVGSHLAVARAVASGGADAGMALCATAQACGLDFVPLDEVRFDFVIPGDQLDHPAVALLLDVLQSRRLRTELAALPGYDVSRMGTIVAKVPAGQ